MKKSTPSKKTTKKKVEEIPLEERLSVEDFEAQELQDNFDDDISVDSESDRITEMQKAMPAEPMEESPAQEGVLESPVEELVVIGIGASAGGLEALREFLGHPAKEWENFAIVIAQHLSPTYKSMLVQLLSRATDLPVSEITHGTVISKGRVYITPPDSEVTINKNKLELKKPMIPTGPKPSVDVFFTSLAKVLKERAVGVILSGTGSDGSRGIVSIKDHGGLTLVQEPKSAKYDGMPVASIQTGRIDFIMPPEQMVGKIEDYFLRGEKKNSIRPAEEGNSLERLMRMLSDKMGTNFSNYKYSTISRRLDKRISVMQLTSLDEYIAYCEDHPGELDRLFHTILIGVTQFYRDKEAYQQLEHFLREVVSEKQNHVPIRVWIAGSSTGEEPYSIAIIIKELLKECGKSNHVQIFATDIDEGALLTARKGIYSSASVEHVPPELLRTYFSQNGDQFEIAKVIRQMVLFSRHDLTIHPPFLKLDLVSCRNLLIYFGTELQKHLIPIFHYALNPGGYLFLGKSETVGAYSDLFSAVDAKHKLFQRRQGSHVHTIQFSALKPVLQTRTLSVPVKPSTTSAMSDLVMQTMYHTYEHPYLILSETMDVQHIFGDVAPFCKLQQGVMNTNVINLIKKDYQTELRALLSKAVNDRVTLKGDFHSIDLDGKQSLFRIIVLPLLFTDSANELYMLIFERLEFPESLIQRVSYPEGGSDDIRVKALEEQLSTIQEHMQSYIEELETANEEMQALNEELQSSNEELQSTNEELETANEELQSTNEEIQIAYNELRYTNMELERREQELQNAQANLNAVINNTLQAFILIDKYYHVLTLNNAAREFSKVHNTKIIKSGDTIIDYPVFIQKFDFHQNFQRCILGEIVSGEVDMLDRSGREHYYYYNFTPVNNTLGQVETISLAILDMSELRVTRKELSKSELMISSVFESADIGICVTDENGILIKFNKGFCDLALSSHDELDHSAIFLVIPEENRPKFQSEYAEDMMTGKSTHREIQLMRKDGTIIDVIANSNTLIIEGKYYRTITMRDITESKKYRNLLEGAQEAAKIGGWEYDVILNEYNCTEEMNHIYCIPAAQLITPELFEKPYEPAARNTLERARIEAVEYGLPYDLELEFVDFTGIRKWVRITCKPIRAYNKTIKLFGTLQDITMRKQSEQEFLKLSLVARKTRNAVLLLNNLRQVQWVNDGFQTISGCSFDEVHGRLIEQVLFGNELEFYADQQLYHKMQSYEAFLGMVRCKAKNGEHYWLQVDVTPVIGSKNQVTDFVLIGADITERKRAEADLIEAKNKAEEMNRLKSNFLANMSHELRTPLVGILGFGELLMDNPPGIDLSKIGNKLFSNGKRLLETLNSIFDFSKIEANSLEIQNDWLSLDPLVQEVVESYNLLAQKHGLFIEYRKPQIPIRLFLDARMLRQILLNIMNNAVKFTEEGGVTVFVEIIQLNSGTSEAVLSFSDTGIGIAEENIDDIFTEFRQASEGKNRNFEGTGLGLTIAKRFAEMMNCRITVKSALGQGSTFSVHLPYTDLGSEVPLETNKEAAPSRTTATFSINPKVLLVENEETHQEIFSYMVKDVCDLDVVSNGKDAVALAETNDYSMVFLDINLGKGLSGIEVVTKLRLIPSYKNKPIVAVTAFASREDREEFLSGMFNFYLSKPFQKDDLISLMNTIMESR